MRLAPALPIALLVLVLAGPEASAQVDVAAGWSYSMPSVQVDDSDVDNVQNRSGFNLGGFIDRGGMIGYRAGLLYSQKGFDSDTASVELNYIEVPAMLRIDTPFLRVYGGVNLGFEIDCNVEQVPAPGGLPFACENETETLDIGFRLGAGARLTKFSLDVAYVFSTTDVWRSDRGSIEHRVLQVALGLRF